MKLVATVLMLSAVPLCEVRAEEAIAQDHRLAQTQQQKSESLPTGSCMPIGLTARGEIVFPWDCRELIEKQRGPVSEEIPKPKDSISKETAASPSPEPEQVFATPGLSPTLPQVPAANDQPSERGPHAKKLSGRRQKKHGDPALQPDPKITGAIK